MENALHGALCIYAVQRPTQLQYVSLAGTVIKWFELADDEAAAFSTENE